MRIVSVRIGRRGIVILPDREVELGEIAPDETVRLSFKTVGAERIVEVEKIKQPGGALSA